MRKDALDTMNEKMRKTLIEPPREFSPMPFWFWNDELEKKEIIKQINDFHLKEVNGFVIHPRMGIPEALEYMSDEFLGYVKCAVEEAARLGMQVVLYDEAMYPSGSAHGMVSKTNPQFASKGLKVIESVSAEKLKLKDGERFVCTLGAKKTAENILDKDSIFEITDEKLPDGFTALHFLQGFTNGHIRGIHVGEDDWENPPKSTDLLSEAAVDCFISLTHEKYYGAVSEYFGNTVIGIFTDEPCIMGREPNEGMQPWTDVFTDDISLSGLKKTELAALWYDIGENTQIVRKKYLEAVHNRLRKTFYEKIYDWCENHKIDLMGHPGESQDIGLLKYFHTPGQDLIFRRVAPENNMGICGAETTQAKCSADSARHRGRLRNLNECFACSGKNSNEWTFSFDDMKWMTDWLIVRGVNMLVPHAFFYSMNGERRFGERPPDVGPNNIWWNNYRDYARYVKRLCYLMTDSVNTPQVAVLCEAERLPHEIVKVLFENQTEFNYLEQELLPECEVTGGEIKIANQKYNTLIIDDISLIDDDVCQIAEKGVKVIAFSPENAKLPDGIITVNDIYDVIGHTQKTIVTDSPCKDLRVSCVKKNGEYFYLLVNEGEKEICTKLTLGCGGSIEIFNPWTGTFSDDMKISLNRRESIVICVGNSIDKKAVITLCSGKGNVKEEELTHWYINGEKIQMTLHDAKEKLHGFFGTIQYDTRFESFGKDGGRTILDLGDVREQAEVIINGHSMGEALWAPFVFDITSYINKGENHLRVLVKSSLANKYSKDRQPAGLITNVKLKIEQ